MLNEILRRIEEHERRTANMIRVGKVIKVDAAKGLVKLKVGDLETAWLPWTESAGGTSTWSPPTVGQQMMLVSPSGEPGQGWASPAGFSSDNPAPSGDGDARVQKHGGVTMTTKGGKLIIDAAEVQINGGSLKHNAKNVGDTHIHSGIVRGGAETDPPSN